MVNKFIFAFLLLFFNLLVAQPVLEVNPPHIIFDKPFNKNEPVTFINKGNTPLSINQISYSYDYYFIRFNKPFEYPQTLNPGDTLKMDCILRFFYTFTPRDSADTMSISTNSPAGIIKVPISIKIIGPGYENGIIDGTVKYNGAAVSDAMVYFLFDGTNIFDSVKTNSTGAFSKSLPPGKYTVAAKKDSFYLTFFDSKTDPFNAKYLKVESSLTNTITLNLLKAAQTLRSISGRIFDNISSSALKKGVVVIKKGTHTPPNKITGSEPFTAFSGLIDKHGYYTINNIPADGDFYLQTFSDYFTPAYFSNSGVYPAFWNEADPLPVSGTLTNKNIIMPRDSSIGEGSISGFLLKGKTGAEDSSFNDAIVIALSMDYNIPFSYSLCSEGEFEIEHLPYGRYKIIAQKIGYQNYEISNLKITPQNTKIQNLNLYFTPMDIGDTQSPDEYKLFGCFPNPFNPSTKISFNLAQSGNTVIRVYNILGREVGLILNDYLQSGLHSINFNASGLPSGVYFYRLESGKFTASGKMLLIK